MTGSKEELPSAASDARVTSCKGWQHTTLGSGCMTKEGEGRAVLVMEEMGVSVGWVGGSPGVGCLGRQEDAER
jgi:hypothetical protein